MLLSFTRTVYLYIYCLCALVVGVIVTVHSKTICFYFRLRQGRIGGSWRHIKEVLGHGGSRVVYVDGTYTYLLHRHETTTLWFRLNVALHLFCFSN